MLKYNNPVKSVLLREPISLLGKFDLQRLVSTDRFPGMKLIYTQHGIELLYKGSNAIIPFNNIQVFELYPDAAGTD
jgi:hypothetical protein